MNNLMDDIFVDDFVLDGSKLVKYTGKDTTINIPDGIECIGAFAFKDNTQIENVHFHEGLLEIEESAFERCLKLRTVIFPRSLHSIGDKAFSRCFSLRTLEFNKELERIGEYSFSFCEDLESVWVETWCESIPATAFNHCSSLRAIKVSEGNRKYTSSSRHILYTKDYEELIRCPEALQDSSVMVDERTKLIGEYAFCNCFRVENLIIPDGLCEVGAYAFKDCLGIKELVLNAQLSKFEASAIEGWTENQVIRAKSGFKWSELTRIHRVLTSQNAEIDEEIEYKYVYVVSTFESQQETEKMIKMLLDRRYVASGQITPIHSIYRWEESLNSEDEYELKCITEYRMYEKIKKFISENHSYEVCQITCIPILKTTKDFEDWISGNLKGVCCDE